MSVERKVFLFRNEAQIFKTVIQLVSIPVVDAHPSRNSTVMFFPNHLTKQSPTIWLGNLHPCALFSASLVTCPNAYRSDR